MIEKWILFVFIMGSFLLTGAVDVEVYTLENQIQQLQKELEAFKFPKDGVMYNGQLALNGTQLVNQVGDPIQLKGMSSHGVLWYPEFLNYRSVRTTKEYGANVFRIAMYTSSKDGYVKFPEASKKNVFAGVENVLGADMYAIIDWHILEDGDPNTHIDDAKAFFSEISAKYAGEPGIIYEICNEPNGRVKWSDVKRYANLIIPVIRKNSPQAIIIVGTPKHSTSIADVVKDPIMDDNIMYAYHFYSGTSDSGYRYNIFKALEQNLPVFVTEWGLDPQKGSKAIDYEQAQAFVDFMDEHQISWTNWSLSNKDEIYSVIKPEIDKLSNWEWDDLTENGQFVFRSLSTNSKLK